MKTEQARGCALAAVLGLCFACSVACASDSPSDEVASLRDPGPERPRPQDDAGSPTVSTEADSAAVPRASHVSSPRNSYPFAPDQAVSGGSVEGNPGSSWDFCFTTSPGLLPTQQTQSTGSDGGSYLSFDSDAECRLCRAEGTQCQAMFALSEPLRPEQQALWFEIRTSDPSLEAQGTLTFASVGESCETLSLLTELDLADLSPNTDWSTRCVNIEATSDVTYLGLVVQGESFRFDFDALRVGPSCTPQ